MLKHFAIPTAVFAFLVGCGASSPNPELLANRVAPPKRPPAASASWAQLSHDAARTGYNSLEHTLGVSNVGELQNGWLLGTGGQFTWISESGSYLYATDDNGALYKISVSTGVPKWAYRGQIAYAGISVISGRVFFDCVGSGGHDGLCAVNTTTGKLDWSYGTEPTGYPYNGPAVSGDDVVFGESTSSGSRGEDGYLVDLNATSGTVNWIVGNCGDTGGNNCGAIGYNPAAISKGVIYYGTNGSGESGFTNGVCARQLSNGALLWCRQTGDASTAPSVSGSTVYAEAESKSVGILYALNAMTGASIWSYSWEGGYSYGEFEPAIANGIVYAFLPPNTLAAFKAKSGKQLWNVPTGGESPPAVANGVIYHSANNGSSGASVAAYAAANGSTLWASNQTGRTTAGPIVVNGAVYAPCNGGSPSERVDALCKYHLPANHARKR